MGILNFCKECGARRVSDVKIQLEKLFTNKQITAHLCGICSAPLWVAESIKIQFQECSGDTIHVPEGTVVSTVISTTDTETGGEATDHQKNSDGCKEEKYNSRADKRLTRLSTGTIEPQNHRENESGEDIDNESIDVPFYLVVESQDSNSDEEEDDDSSKMLEGKKNIVKKISSLSVQAGSKIGKKHKHIKKESQPHQEIDQDSNSDERLDDLSKMFEGKKNTVEAGQKTGKKQKRIKKVSQPHQEIKLTKDQFEMYRSLDPKILAMLDVDEEILTKTLKCKECKGSFRQLNLFMRHISTHTGEKLSIAKPYICQICENRFATMTEFEIHMARHTKQKFVCQWVNCFATFGCKRYLTKHVKRQHEGHKYVNRGTGIKERKFVCTADKCKYRTAFSFAFKLHQNTHTNTRPYKCNYCDRCFNNPNCKRSHETNKHSNRKDHHHICEICGYSTSKKPDLTKHQRIHFGEKPFACNQCDYRSNRRDNLVKHLRIHSGNKPYKCFCCELVFLSLKACKNHEKKHSPRQPQPTAYQEGRGDAQTGKHFSRDENNFLCNETNKILPNNDAQSVDRNHPVSTSDETLEVTSHPVACGYNAGHSGIIPALAEPSQRCQTAQAKTQSEESIGAVSFLQHLQQM